jgi:hypothetical protein
VTAPHTIEEFDRRLSRHDWYFAYSDDGGVFRAGDREADELLRVAMQSAEHAALYDAWSKFRFSGDHFGCPKFTSAELLVVRRRLGAVP